MMLRRTREQQHWFYGCSQFPGCRFTFDADQVSGAPVFHTRYGIPFRAERSEKKGAGALFEALKRNGFNIEAGQRLEQAQQKSRASRQRALKDMDREQVESRIKAAAPKTAEEWLEFILQERLQAIQDHRNETLSRQLLNGVDGKKLKATAAEIVRSLRLNR